MQSTSTSQYYKEIMLKHDENVQKIYEQYDKRRRLPIILKRTNENLDSKTLESLLGKRSYVEAMGYNNDYNIVQESDPLLTNYGSNWVDAYTENLLHDTKDT
jgi:hypothetical protein